MRPEIDYVYNKLKRLRFDFNSSDFKGFRSEYRYEPTLDRYVRKDDNDLFIAKDTFKPLEEELEYADKCHNLEEELGNNLSGKNEDCSFKVLFEATKYGFWHKVKYLNKYIHLVPDENHTIVYSWNDGYPILQYMEVTNDIYYTLQCVYDVFITDYKKTFWLKEDMSE